MGAETIIRQKTIRYHHLDDIRVTEIITKVSLLRKSGSPRTEGMRRIAEESGCGINTIYRLARLSVVEFKKWDIRKADYVTHHHEMSTDAVKAFRKMHLDQLLYTMVSNQTLKGVIRSTKVNDC